MWSLIRTNDSIGPLIARATLGLVMLPHGLQKTLGWFGGPGLENWVGYASSMGIPAPVAVLVALSESVGALLLLSGLIGRFAALGVIGVMAGAVAMVHGKVGFFMNWGGTQQGEGFEYHILAVGLALIVVSLGSGKASLDAVLQRKLGAGHRNAHSPTLAKAA